MKTGPGSALVNFDFSDDQKMLRDQARKFLDEKCSRQVVRGVLNDAGKSFDAALWKGVAEQGWLGVAIPEEHGGLGLGGLELCVLAEEIGRAVAPIPFSSTIYFFAEAILASGSAAQKKALLPKIADGDLIGASPSRKVRARRRRPLSRRRSMARNSPAPKSR